MSLTMLENPHRLHQAAVVRGFLFQLHGVGARRRGHAPQTHRAASEDELVAGPHLRHGDAVVVGEDGEALLPGADDVVAQRQLLEQGGDVGLLDDFQVFVRGVAAQSAHGRGGVVDGNAALAEQGLDVGQPEGAVLRVHQPLAVAEKHNSKYLPHLVGVFYSNVKEPIHSTTQSEASFGDNIQSFHVVSLDMPLTMMAFSIDYMRYHLLRKC